MSRRAQWQRALVRLGHELGLWGRELAWRSGLRSWPRGARVHVGCGPERLEGWINVDMVSLPSVDHVLDVSRCLPFRESEAIFAEHFLEHLGVDQVFAFLDLCHAALAEGGWIRLSTPNLAWLWVSQPPRQRDGGGRSPEDLRAAMAPNRCFYGWEHRFLWSRGLLHATLEACGFVEVRSCRYGESELPFFRGIERHLREPDSPDLPHVLIVEARKGPRQEAQRAELRRLFADEFLCHLSPEHAPRS